MNDDLKFSFEQKIKIFLTEYTEIRSMIKLNIQHQITLLATAMTTVGIAIGFAGAILDMNSRNIPSNQPVLEFLLFVIVPGICMFFEVLWLDQAFRQLRAASYTRKLEESLYMLIQTLDDISDFPEGYERYLDNIAKPKTFNIHRFYYYICLGVFLLLPSVSVYAGMILMHLQVSDILPIYIIMLAIIYILGLLFSGIYVKNILALFKNTGRSSRFAQQTGLLYYIKKLLSICKN